MTSAPEASEEHGAAGRGVLRWVGTVLANVTVLTALLVYFGWQRSESHARALGFDESVLGMSIRDYLLRSVGAAFPVVGVIALVGLLWAVLDESITALMSNRDRGARSESVLSVFSFSWIWLPMVLVMVWQVWPVVGYLGLPLSFGAGVLLSLYASHLRRLPGGWSEQPDWRRGAVIGFTFLVVAVSLFWAATSYADVLGRRLARELPAQLDGLTRVVVYSAERLHISAPGAAEEPLDGAASRYRFRYTGLRLLDRVGGKYFLVSEGWTRVHGVVVALPDNDTTIRVEFVRDNRR